MPGIRNFFDLGVHENKREFALGFLHFFSRNDYEFFAIFFIVIKIFLDIFIGPKLPQTIQIKDLPRFSDVKFLKELLFMGFYVGKLFAGIHFNILFV